MSRATSNCVPKHEVLPYTVRSCTVLLLFVKLCKGHIALGGPRLSLKALRSACSELGIGDCFMSSILLHALFVAASTAYCVCLKSTAAPNNSFYVPEDLLVQYA